MKYLYLVFCIMVGMTTSAYADITQGENLYTSKGCIGCHGPAGNSPNPATFPKTAGLGRDYLVTQLKAFRDGTRNNPMMSPMSKGLTDEEINYLADYLAAQK